MRIATIFAFSFVLLSNLGALSVPADAQKSKKVTVSCAQQSENDGCWIALAQAVKNNPNANQFSTSVRRVFGEFAVANSVMDTFVEYRWFYNKNTETVDFVTYVFDPPDDTGERGRKRYDNVTSELLLIFLREQGSSKKRDFDSFATQHGSRVILYKNRGTYFRNMATPQTQKERPQ